MLMKYRFLKYYLVNFRIDWGSNIYLIEIHGRSMQIFGGAINSILWLIWKCNNIRCFTASIVELL